ncbi:hypothetical protein BDW75DRAFT_233814 [Aspergillus navahoensis]
MAQACEKCRLLKVKCVRVEAGKPCVKCTKAKSQCIVPEPKQRARRGRKNPWDQIGGEWLDHGTLRELNMDFVQTLDSTTARSSAMMWAPPTNTDSSWITDLGLSLAVLEHLLDSFRSCASHFPFIVIPAGWRVVSMAEDRPFLLLSAVTCASSGYGSLQQALTEELKETLSHRVVIAGEKDLDLLQGLLVHLAWFHFYLDPRSQQTYQYLQMAISMVVDLGLEQRITDMIKNQTCSREVCRTYLGCYYLSSVIARDTSKPDNFHCSEQVLHCTRMLQQEQEFPTDKFIYPMIKLQQLTQEVCDIYQHVILTSGYRAMKMRIYEMGLVYKYGQKKRPPAGVPGDSMTAASSRVSLNLTKCLICAKEFLDIFMAIPEREHDKLPLAVWYQLIMAVVVLYRLSVGLPDTPGWNREIAQETVNLPEYLNTLSHRLRCSALRRGVESSPSKNKCLFKMFPDMVESVTSVPWNSQSAEADWRKHNGGCGTAALYRCGYPED